MVIKSPAACSEGQYTSTHTRIVLQFMFRFVYVENISSFADSPAFKTGDLCLCMCIYILGLNCSAL